MTAKNVGCDSTPELLNWNSHEGKREQKGFLTRNTQAHNMMNITIHCHDTHSSRHSAQTVRASRAVDGAVLLGRAMETPNNRGCLASSASLFVSSRFVRFGNTVNCLRLSLAFNSSTNVLVLLAFLPLLALLQ